MRSGYTLLLSITVFASILFIAFWIERRMEATPAALEFIPADAGTVLVVPSIASAWSVLQPHLTRLDDGASCSDKAKVKATGRLLYQALFTLRCDKEIRVFNFKTLSDLTAQGLDVSRSAAIGIMLGSEVLYAQQLRESLDPHFIAAIPIGKASVFLAALIKAGKKVPADCLAGDATKNDSSACLTFIDTDTDTGYAIYSNSAKLVRSMKARRGLNINKWTSNDAFSTLTGEAKLTSDTLALSAYMTGASSATVLISGSPSKLHARARLHPGKPVANVEKAFLDPVSMDMQRARLVPSQSPTSIFMTGAQLGKRLAFLKDFSPDPYEALRKLLLSSSYSFQPLLDNLHKSSTLNSMSIGVVDVRNGVPEIVIALDMSETEGNRLVLDLQKKNVLNRYRQLFSRLKRCKQPTDGLALPPECNGRNIVPDAIAAELSQFEPIGAYIDEEQNVAFPLGTFSGAEYLGCSGNVKPCSPRRSCVYIAPRVTRNDMNWILKSSNPNDLARLSNGEYRLASCYDEQSRLLWIGLDLSTLSKAFEMTRSGRQFELRPQGNSFEYKMDPRWVWSKTLHGTKDSDDFAKTIAKDLQNYRNVTAFVRPLGQGRGLLLEVSLE